MAQFTKAALAQCLKERMREKPLERITVKELVDACQVNRNTFYYHFQDIYDLLGWIYKTEALGALGESHTFATWQQGLMIILRYVEEHREMCINTYRSIAREHLELFLNEVLGNLLGEVVDEVAKERPILPEHRQFIVQFYSFAFAGVLLEWISKGVRTAPETIVGNMSLVMEGTFRQAVERFSQEERGDKKSGPLF